MKYYANDKLSMRITVLILMDFIQRSQAEWWRNMVKK